MPEMPGSTALISRLLLASLPTRPLLLFFKPWIVLFLHLYLDKTQTSAEGRGGKGGRGGDGRKKKEIYFCCSYNKNQTVSDATVDKVGTVVNGFTPVDTSDYIFYFILDRCQKLKQ